MGMKCPYCGEELQLIKYRPDHHKIRCRKCYIYWEEELKRE